MRDAVYKKFGVWLEYEMEILGLLEEDLETKVRLKKPHQFKLEELEPMRQKFKKNLGLGKK